MPKKTFEVWMQEVTVCMVDDCGMGPEDIDDYDYARAYAAHEQPRITAKRALNAAKEACGL